MLDQLFDLVATFWKGDSELRERSILGESRLDKDSRKTVALLCGGLIALLAIGVCLIWYLL